MFMGSWRRLLRDVFESRTRPFYKSSIKLELERLPLTELTTFIEERFQVAGRPVDRAVAEEIATYTEGYPYYAQKLAMLHFELLEDGTTDLDSAKRALLKSESSGCENIFVKFTVDVPKCISWTTFILTTALSKAVVKFWQENHDQSFY